MSVLAMIATSPTSNLEGKDDYEKWGTHSVGWNRWNRTRRAAMPRLELDLPQDMADCVDWLVGQQQSTREHILLALLNNALVALRDAVDDEDFDLMADQLALTMKRYFRAEAPEIWARRARI